MNWKENTLVSWKAVYTFQCWQNVSKKHPSLMMWGRRRMHVRGSGPTSWGNVAFLLVVHPVSLNLLTDTMLAVGSVLYWRHPFLKIEEILHSHFQSSLLKKYCNVVWVVNLLKTSLMNQQSRHMWKVIWRISHGLLVGWSGAEQTAGCLFILLLAVPSTPSASQVCLLLQ